MDCRWTQEDPPLPPTRPCASVSARCRSDVKSLLADKHVGLMGSIVISRMDPQILARKCVSSDLYKVSLLLSDPPSASEETPGIWPINK